VFRPRSADHAGDQTWPELLLLRVEGRLFFANAATAGQAMHALIRQRQPREVVIDGSALIDLEYSALRMLDAAERDYAARGIRLVLAGLNPPVLAMVQRQELGQRLGREGLLFNLERAVEQYEQEHPRASGPVTDVPGFGAWP